VGMLNLFADLMLSNRLMLAVVVCRTDTYNHALQDGTPTRWKDAPVALCAPHSKVWETFKVRQILLMLAGQGCGGSPHGMMSPHGQVHLVFVAKLCSSEVNVTTVHDRLLALCWQNGTQGSAHRLQGCLVLASR